MELTYNTPALLFPAISLLMLAYTNRFLSLASLIRKLHDEYTAGKTKGTHIQQIRNLRKRLNLIRYMQGLGIASFLLCVICMYFILLGYSFAAHLSFTLALIILLLSLALSLIEISISTKALQLELSDIEELELSNIFKNILNRNEENKSF